MNHQAAQLLTTAQDDSNVIDPALLSVDHSSSGTYDWISPQLLSPSSELPPAIEAELDLHCSHNAVWPSGRSGSHSLSGPSQMATVAPNSQQQDGLSASSSDRLRSARATHPITDPFTTSHGRQLPRRRSRYLTRQLGAQAGPIVIPNASGDLNPMERWRNSPPEEEPALIPDIIDALKTAPSLPDSISQGALGGSSHAFRQYRRAASTTSGESSASSRDSQQSGRSTSSAEDPLAVQGRGSRVRKGKALSRKRQTTAKTTSSTQALRRYCCTFCCDRFKSKYDWARHEKSLHVTLEAWYCAPFGTTVLSSTAPETTLCAFCGALDPDIAHLNDHDATACETKPGTRRSFRRKDHLMQHLRLVHHILPTKGGGPLGLESWKIGQSAITSRCGFCDTRLRSWEERVEHLAEHFRSGQTMADWRGEHEFPADFAALVANALPPYLLGSESLSVIPFSATNCDVQDHFAQISSRAQWSEADQQAAREIVAPAVPSVAPPLQAMAPGVAPDQLSSFTQVLTLHLSRFAREQMRKGVVPTDEMFQQESRRVLYDSEDTWNQTVADNPEWLAAFRGLHCEKNGEGEGEGKGEIWG
ncbi:C2H2-type zinc finger protein [Aspergillus brunneoviolaceus CBS 621.78]|uniref:Uncharacterized protein n=1 Tax=Aspergillus brunneoviolaceus CBS 621.78 TaxID=1450534 RepID=A0ACD1GQ20_9EURO|nr:hypothetical protein BO95DRAFT_510266 [Aspergillus brunneoviolaceus CBS 621.78]RAH51213.1 hypothetical protein BO95DRAFT_510266 [Aspergillus brunneoviolaceus CBS 621.78]